MENYRYLIVGTGMTAYYAARGIREIDKSGSIGLVGTEPDPPYKRPSLSKQLWKGEKIESIWLKMDKVGAELLMGRKIVSIHPGEHRALDEQGRVYSYEKLLLATGGSPRRLPFGGENILYFRSLADYRRLREASEDQHSFAVIGGGFIGSEIAAALAMNGKKVTLVFPEEGIGGLVYPKDLSQYLNRFFREKGVELLTQETVTDVKKQDEKLALLTGSGKTILADSVVAGIGILPNLELAREADIETNRGILVDERLATSRADIYAAGDVAEFYNPALGKRMRIEHEDNATAMGRQAGRNMAGAGEPYHHLPFFYSDLFELGYEAVGELNPRMDIVADWQELYRRGVIYYLENERVRGVLLWNVWDQVKAARKLIAEQGIFKPEDLKGRLPAKELVTNES